MITSNHHKENKGVYLYFAAVLAVVIYIFFS
jgi:hypothetical protein